MNPSLHPVIKVLSSFANVTADPLAYLFGIAAKRDLYSPESQSLTYPDSSMQAN